jgi:hypothetical protein
MSEPSSRAVVSIIWSLIIAFVVAGFWSLGEFLYLCLTRPRASYRISAWSLGVGALVFVWMLYVSYKARLNVARDNRVIVGLPASDHDRAAGELSEFLTRMRQVDGPALGMAAVQAADVAARLYADTDGKIDLRSPRAALASRPALLTELTEAVIQLQKAGHQFEAPGTIIWVNTLRAELMPELRPSVKQMWSLISRGGLFYVAEEATRYEEKTGRSLSNNNIIFRVVPEGCGE